MYDVCNINSIKEGVNERKQSTIISNSRQKGQRVSVIVCSCSGHQVIAHQQAPSDSDFQLYNTKINSGYTIYFFLNWRMSNVLRVLQLNGNEAFHFNEVWLYSCPWTTERIGSRCGTLNSNSHKDYLIEFNLRNL